MESQDSLKTSPGSSKCMSVPEMEPTFSKVKGISYPLQQMCMHIHTLKWCQKAYN